MFKSVQRGNALYSNGGSPVSITISSVTISKAAVRYLGVTPESTGTFYSGQGYFVLTSSTNLNFTARYSTVGPFGQYASWEVLEFI
jgi:hypothetical protein